MNSGTRLRLARQARGLSQQQLAGMADVSRQAVSAVESGQSDPSLRVALALAGALGVTVDELFGPEARLPIVAARLITGPGESGAGESGAGESGTGESGTGESGTGDRTIPAPLSAAGGRVTLAPIDDSLVALPLSGPTTSRPGFLPAGGLVVAAADAPLGTAASWRSDTAVPRRPDTAVPRRSDAAGSRRSDSTVVRLIGPPRPTLVVAGCDPALPLLSEPLSLLDPPIAFSWWPCSSREALRLAASGLVHAAGVHLRDESGGYNTASVAELLPSGGEVIGFSAWREGLVLRRETADRVTGLEDLAEARLRLVNREPGAEARRVLDRELASLGIDGRQLPGYDTSVAGHLQVADAIAAGLADAGIASEPAALAYRLAFIPIVAERFDLVVPAVRAASREVQALAKVLSSRWLLDQLASLPGYDPSPCGQHMATLTRDHEGF